jgi:hypothetical protein
MQKTQCFHWVFSFDAHWWFCGVPPTVYTNQFFNGGFLPGSSAHPLSPPLQPVPLQNVRTGVRRRPEILMPQPRLNRLQ